MDELRLKWKKSRTTSHLSPFKRLNNDVLNKIGLFAGSIRLKLKVENEDVLPSIKSLNKFIELIQKHSVPIDFQIDVLDFNYYTNPDLGFTENVFSMLEETSVFQSCKTLFLDVGCIDGTKYFPDPALTEHFVNAKKLPSCFNFRALNTNTTLSYLSLSLSRYALNRFGFANSLAEALKFNKGITTLELHYPSKDDFEDEVDEFPIMHEVAGALKVNKTLRELIIEGELFDCNEMSELAEALQVNKALTKIDLRWCNILLDGLCSLEQALKHNNTLKSLYVGYQQSADDMDDPFLPPTSTLAEGVKCNKALTRLDFSHSVIWDITTLAEALKSNHTLTSLNLYENHIEDASRLAEALKYNHTLTALDLSMNPIGDIGLSLLAEALKHNQTMIKLGLKNNRYGKDGISSLAEVLKHNQTSLRYLQIDLCFGISSMTEAIRYNQTLTHLEVAFEREYDQVMGEADFPTDELNRESLLAFAEALNSNRKLSVLFLSYHHEGCGHEGWFPKDIVAVSLAQILKANKTLTTLMIQEKSYCLDFDFVSTFADSLKDNDTLNFLGLDMHDKICSYAIPVLANSLKGNKSLTTFQLPPHVIHDEKVLLESALKHSNPNIRITFMDGDHFSWRNFSILNS